MAPLYYAIVAFPCAVGAIALALLHIYKHLLNYTEPTFQRYIVRIIFMVPGATIGAVVVSLSGRVLKPSWYLMTCCFPAIPLDGRFIRRCKQGGLQFVILKPILVAITFVLYAKGKYKDGNFSVNQGYLYITIIYTISYTMALYALALFYVGCRDLLRPYNPVPKFLMIKSVVFLTYWQVVGHFYGFPYKEYAGANIGPSRGLTGSLAHAVKFSDFYHDTVHQFAPTYHDYVLYNNTEGDEGARKYRSRTFVPTGHEMDAVRRSKYDGRLDDVQLSSVSASGTNSPTVSSTSQDLEAIKTSLLKEASSFASQPYDLSLIINTDLSSYPEKVPAVDTSKL